MTTKERRREIRAAWANCENAWVAYEEATAAMATARQAYKEAIATAFQVFEEAIVAAEKQQGQESRRGTK